MSDSIENILIGLVRDSNDHIDKINNSVLSNNALLQTLVEKVTKIEEENKCLREKMDSVIETNTLLRDKIEHMEKPKPITKKSSKVPKEPKIECSAMTAKGHKCTKPCTPGEKYCTLHIKMHEKQKCLPVPTEPKKKRPILKKKKKEVPLHNHKPGELPTETCELCETHGDIFDPDMPNSEFEESQDDGDISIEEKLRKMLDEEEIKSE
jgi:hypothetical protein